MLGESRSRQQCYPSSRNLGADQPWFQAGCQFPGQMSHLASGTLGKRAALKPVIYPTWALSCQGLFQSHSHSIHLATSSVSLSCSAIGTLKLTQTLSGADCTGRLVLETLVLPWPSLALALLGALPNVNCKVRFADKWPALTKLRH